ncbi:hypothetical protein G1K46_12515 [Tenacibaculum finnmarkense]|uniref:Uncharacterized protein n=1 Tax=Tenacibaculum piscium TaxID=1458515 RepID=A0A2H1YGE2_9FLAO|nr:MULTISPECIES: HEPN domain-containing protein [Tenacibaculum]MBE7630515.1 hypothetical protein [Tenacibaculum piscium]MCD8413619.1 hypothetical protein [Tenacibaculum finnmarkense genomovar ulcerans]MCD8440976.1 hypothetical protein [Tenacibaculum finnmarkense genomovar ulcerans]MCG8721900.1 hypothetical protein [Tenacibaculum finnmarkense]MCG8763539.1 hypothetical protein [Tenacibaculum finnmarkense]
MYYRYPILTKIPYTDFFRYRDIFQIIPFKEEEFNLKLSEYHFVNILEINLEELFKYIDKSIDIQLLFIENNELLESGKESINLTEAEPLIKFDYYINYAKSLVIEILSTITIFEHFDYPNETSNGWFREINPKNKEITVKWGKKWLPISNSPIKSFSKTLLFNKIEENNSLQYFKTIGSSYKKIKFPSDIEEKLNNFFKLDIEVRDVLNNSFIYFLHANHIKEDFPSLAIVSLINSIENLVNYNHKNTKVQKCNECGQDRYRITKKFNDFLDENLQGYYSRKEIKGMIGDIYSKRSKIVHTGNLYKSEKNKPIWEDSLLDSTLDLTVIITVTRIVINSWIKNYCA